MLGIIILVLASLMTGWRPMIFEELSQTQQLWLEGGQHSIRSLPASKTSCASLEISASHEDSSQFDKLPGFC